jgi:hypothetical protein
MEGDQLDPTYDERERFMSLFTSKQAQGCEVILTLIRSLNSCSATIFNLRRWAMIPRSTLLSLQESVEFMLLLAKSFHVQRSK